MKITHFCNSFLAVREAKTLLMCDPWIGTANYGGWLSYPLADGEEEIFRRHPPTRLYISHLHSDHLCAKVLAGLPDKNIPVYIKLFKDGALYRRLTALGFGNVAQLAAWKPMKISDELEITIIPADASNSSGLPDEISYDLDTSILIRSLVDGTVFFNTVDNPMTLEQYGKVKEFVRRQSPRGKIDVACIGVGAASEYPQCFPGIDRQSERDRIIAASLQKFESQLAALGNEVYFPAGGTYLIPGKFSMLNRYIAQPGVEQLRTVVASSSTCKSLYEIEGGDSIEKNGAQWVRSDGGLDRLRTREEAIQAYANLAYEYTRLPPAPDCAIDDLFPVARENYFARLAASSVEVKWRIVFHLYDDLRLDGDGRLPKDAPVRTLTLSENGRQHSPYELICHLDHRLFLALLKRQCIWNITLSGSIVIFERTPNIFVPEITFSLNYLTI